MKIFRSPWFWTVLFVLISSFTTWLNGFYSKLEYWLLQTVPSSQTSDDGENWVDWYTFILVFVAPIIAVFFLSKLAIKQFAKSR